VLPPVYGGGWYGSPQGARRGLDLLHATKNRYVGAVSVGWGPDGKRLRRKVRGKTKQEARDKLRALHRELSDGVRSPGRYSLRQAVEDWLRDGLDGRSERTLRLYEGCLSRLWINQDWDTPSARQATACGIWCSSLWAAIKAATATAPSRP
jgi:hypothetical protein